MAVEIGVMKISSEVRKNLFITLTVLAAITLLTIFLLYETHVIYTIKYDAGWIIGSSISDVEERYGKFDLEKSGYAAYYIYTDDFGFMPDGLEHYYCMRYDSDGMVYEAYDGCQPGG